jgi:hypothetical protein
MFQIIAELGRDCGRNNTTCTPASANFQSCRADVHFLIAARLHNSA